MIAKSYIKSTLEELNQLYNSASSQKKAIYFSKLAVLELCGWIEEVFDDIIIRHSKRNLRLPVNKLYTQERIVNPNYGFDYKKNIRPMFIGLIGLIQMEKLEKELEKTGKITLLKSYLGSLRVTRNKAAHTHLRGVTVTYNAPSQTLGDFHRICTILEIIDSELRK